MCSGSNRSHRHSVVIKILGGGTPYPILICVYLISGTYYCSHTCHPPARGRPHPACNVHPLLDQIRPTSLLLVQLPAIGGTQALFILHPRQCDASILITRDAKQMLFYCWASVVDAGPATKQHCLNIYKCH